ncbi:hypothetical protein LCGC14_2566340 [marine sediment metagenome]|uniref:Uncharacterized protein n=1 Tax=marine sediment metagenome TaxID=412755 RepID=A0A0F9AIH4_9ZZZZ
MATSIYTKYAHRYCQKTGCISHENYKCKIGLHPTNNNKAKKLHQSRGYCDSYISLYEAKFRKIAFGILSKEKEKFQRKLKREINRLQEILIVNFNHNITAPHFNALALNIFISLENNLEKNYKLPPKTPLYEAKKQLPTITQSYKYLKEDLVEIINRGFGNKPYKLKNKKFHDKHHAVKQKYINFIRYIN